MNLYDEIIDFETIVGKIKHEKSRSSGVKENYKSKNWEDYKNMPQDLNFTKNKTMELVLNETVMLAPENLKRLLVYNVSTPTTLMEK